MSLCVVCGYATLGADEMCSHHAASFTADWAEGNKLMCDLLHRGIIATPPRRSATRKAVARSEAPREVAA